MKSYVLNFGLSVGEKDFDSKINKTETTGLAGFEQLFSTVLSHASLPSVPKFPRKAPLNKLNSPS